MGMESYKGVMVFAEQRDGHLQSVAFELVGKARALADTLKTKVTAVIIGSGIKGLADSLIHHGADRVVVIDDKRLDKYMTEPYTKSLYNLIQDEKPEIVLFGATSIGRDLAPRVSARVHTGLTADCTSLEIEENTNNLLMTRPAFGGNIMATIVCQQHRPQMSTVRPGVMQKLQEDTSRTGEVREDFNPGLTDEDFNVEIIEEQVYQKKMVKIEDADILVSAGRGFGSKENIDDLANKLAKVMDATVSGSRAVVDAGWMEKERQVGQTGKTVRPNLYFALGISGAIQHLAGMEESDLIVAVNKNPDAPIFEVSDIGIVGDINKVVPELVKLLEEEKKKNAVE